MDLHEFKIHLQDWKIFLTANTKQRAIVLIFQNFINEHNLWRTTAVLALSVHATVENNFEFLLFSFSLTPTHRHFRFSHYFFLFSSFFFSFFRNSKTAKRWKYWISITALTIASTSPQICPPTPPSPLSCSNNMYTNYIVQKIK